MPYRISEHTVPACTISSKCDCSNGASGHEIVAMMQPAEPRHGDDLRIHRCILCSLSSSRSSFVQPKVRPVIVEVANVLIHETLQMPFVEHDHVVEQIAATGSHPAARQPRFARGCGSWFASAECQSSSQYR